MRAFRHGQADQPSPVIGAPAVVGIVGPADRLLLTIDQVLRAYEEGWFRRVQDAGVPCGPDPDRPSLRRRGRAPIPGDLNP